MQKTLLTFVDDIYEDLELWYPKLRCEEAGLRHTARRARDQDLPGQARLSRQVRLVAQGHA